MNILIADDDSAIRQGLQHIINQILPDQVMFWEAENGLQALHLLSEHPIDLVFSDVRMPILSGIRLLEMASLEFPQTSFIMISAYSEFEYAQSAMRFGALDYILKPIHPHELAEILDHFSKRKHKQTTANKIHSPGKLSLHITEALRLLITEGIHSVYLDQNLPMIWKQTQWYVIAADINVEDPSTLAQFRTILKDSVTHLADNGLYLEHQPHILLVPCASLDDWLQHLQLPLQEAGISYSIGISSRVEEVKNLTQSFFEAKAALQYRLIQHEGSLYYYKPSEALHYALDKHVHHIQKKLHQQPLQLQTEVTHFLNECVRNCQTSPNHLLTILDQFCMKLISSMFDKESKEKLNTLDIDALMDEFRHARSLAQLSDLLYRFITNLMQMQSINTADYYSNVIAEAKRYIAAHLEHDLSLEEVAEHMKLSTGHFSRLFRKMTGVTYISYLTDLRLEEGKKLLQTGQYRIYEVSEKVGYSSWRHFSKLFRYKYGMTPNEFIGKK